MNRSVFPRCLHYAALVVLAALCVAPIAIIFATSLRQQVDIFAEPLNFISRPRWRTTAPCWRKSAFPATWPTA